MAVKCESTAGYGDSNGEYVDGFNKSEGSEKSSGLGLETPAKGVNDVPGSMPSSQEMLLRREAGRINELKSKAFGRNMTITNAGITLDSFGGSYSEASGEKGGGEGEQKGE